MKHDINLNGYRISYHSGGEGPPLLFVHCSSASHREWKGIGSRLHETFQTLMPDLPGYGESGEWSLDEQGNPLVNDTDALAALLEVADEPVHVIAHSYGGAVALQMALAEFYRPSPRIRSLFLVEPVSFHLLRTGGRLSDWASIDRRAGNVIRQTGAGNIKKAADIYMSYWLGWLKWRLAPKKFRAEVHRTMPKVAYEFGNMYRYDQKPGDYAFINCPVTLVCGSKTTRQARAVTEVLGQALGQAETHILDGAGHMSPFTHPEPVYHLVKDHLEKAGS
ncbi:alpha/beta fold hydrolase [Emcibacter sp.]|uniref:alpha/beta fold hydrolase n=1 Tax=Emcibacter sp. TaxID=1979954 RepID=UPI003A93DC0A